MFWQGVLGIGCSFLFIVLFNNVIPTLIKRYSNEDKAFYFMFGVFVLELIYTIVSLVVIAESETYIDNLFFVAVLFTFLIFAICAGVYLIIAKRDREITLKEKLIYSAFALIILLALNTNISKDYEYRKNIISVSTPEITETRYDILAGSDTTRISGSVSGAFSFMRGTTSEDSYYKVFYDTKNELGERVAKPITLCEAETEVVLIAEEDGAKEYLVEVIKTYYTEDRNKEPVERIEEYSETSYKLYLHESTFNGMMIDGNK